MRNIIYLVIITLLLSSCSLTRKNRTVAIPVHSDAETGSYIGEFAELAMNEMKRTGVPASITLAQGIIESDYGRSRLAREANNHFGIKCHNDWNGQKIYHDDDRRNECFRKYRHVRESYYDHSDFLRNGSRYDFLFELSPDDYKGWARGLKKAGYATNPKYAGMLIDMIEKNKLYAYDQLVISGRSLKTESGGAEQNLKGEMGISVTESEDEVKYLNRSSKLNRIKERNRIQYITVREGDTFESLIEEFDLLRWELFRYNDLERDSGLYPGQILYLQPKRKRAEAGKDYHIVQEGETMYSISQHYGIKLDALYEKNRMEKGSEPEAGTELWLRKTKPEGL